LLQCGDQGILGEVLGCSDVPGQTSEAGNQPGSLDSPDRVDRAMGIL
jgi:hypothetical protein